MASGDVICFIVSRNLLKALPAYYMFGLLNILVAAYASDMALNISERLFLPASLLFAGINGNVFIGT